MKTLFVSHLQSIYFTDIQYHSNFAPLPRQTNDDANKMPDDPRRPIAKVWRSIIVLGRDKNRQRIKDALDLFGKVTFFRDSTIPKNPWDVMGCQKPPFFKAPEVSRTEGLVFP